MNGKTGIRCVTPGEVHSNKEQRAQPGPRVYHLSPALFQDISLLPGLALWRSEVSSVHYVALYRSKPQYRIREATLPGSA